MENPEALSSPSRPEWNFGNKYRYYSNGAWPIRQDGPLAVPQIWNPKHGWMNYDLSKIIMGEAEPVSEGEFKRLCEKVNAKL